MNHPNHKAVKLLMKRISWVLLSYVGLWIVLGLVTCLLRLNWFHPLTWHAITIHAVLTVSLFGAAMLVPAWIAFRTPGTRAGWQRVGILLFSVIWILWCGGLGLETLARIFPLYDTAAVNPAVYYFRPGRPLNLFGHKDREFLMDHPPTTFRILAIDDSYTEGVGMALQETFAAVLEQRMNAHLRAIKPGLAVEVFNLGHSGRNTQEEVGLILQDAPLLTPDLVLLAYVLNDAEQHPDPLTTNVKPVWLQWPALNDCMFLRVRSYAFYWLFTRFSQQIDGVQLSVAQHAPDYAGWKQVEQSLDYYRNYLERTQTGNLALVFPLLVPAEYPAQLIGIHQQVAAAFEKRGLTMVDLLPLFQAQNRSLDSFVFSADDGHPNRETHTLIGSALAKMVFDSPDFQNFLARYTPTDSEDLNLPNTPSGAQYRHAVEQALERMRGNEQPAALEQLNTVIGAFEHTVIPHKRPYISVWSREEYVDYVRTQQRMRMQQRGRTQQGETVQWIDGAYAGAYSLKAQHAIAAGDFEEALALLDYVLAISPYDARSHGIRGVIFQHRNSLPEALAEYQSAYRYAMRYASQQTHIPVILQYMGDLYQQLGNESRAQLAYYESSKYQSKL